MIKVGIVGGTGYTGVELLRLLVKHPHAQVVAITSRSEQGLRVDEHFPSLRGHLDIRFSHPDPALLASCDVVFFATPHAVAMHQVPELLGRDTRIIDLSADFRLPDAAIWAQWYGEPHACPQWLEQAVYGLPEYARESIRHASLVACPGCYPTAVQLGLLPLLEQGWADTKRLIANVASGVSGAGRQAKIDGLMSEVSGNFKAYGVSGHRHWPETQQHLAMMANDNELRLTFVPHLLPMVRGIHATLYVELINDAVTLAHIQQAYEQRYADEPWVDVLPPGSHPQTRHVKGSNRCQLAIHQPAESRKVVILAVIDNLVKGASGQAVQNMNIMFGLEETTGLDTVALVP